MIFAVYDSSSRLPSESSGSSTRIVCLALGTGGNHGVYLFASPLSLIDFLTVLESSIQWIFPAYLLPPNLPTPTDRFMWWILLSRQRTTLLPALVLVSVTPWFHRNHPLIVVCFLSCLLGIILSPGH